MRVVIFCHSLVSDWNHGNAHFLRGVCRELVRRGCPVAVFEPEDGWSRTNLVAAHGEGPLAAFRAAYPELDSRLYPPGGPQDLAAVLDAADLVLVHEWNDPELVRRIGAHHVAAAARGHRYGLLFHDTHHRAVTDPAAMSRFDLSGYDGVLAFGACLRDIYLARGWARRAFVWHEAADTTVFAPRAALGPPTADLVWIGNWGDDERTAELDEFLIQPVRRLGLRAAVHGVRYPAEAQAALAAAGIEHRGFLPNVEVPSVLARFRVTVHVPRRPYAAALPGIPTIRMFEALACGVPLVSAPWSDRERLFSPGVDFLVAHDGGEMTRLLAALLAAPDGARALGERGRATVLARHTCAHRVDELCAIADALGVPAGRGARGREQRPTEPGRSAG